MSVALLAALLAGMLLINVAAAWTLARRDRGPGDAPDAEGRPADDDPTGFDAVLARRRDRTRSADGDDASAHASTDARSPSTDPSADGPPPLETDGETVVCGNCGARNRSGYRYCRWCVRSALVDDGRGRGDAAGAARRPL
ncbi:zinc ribbon domain-containing protein [Halorubrum rubrum]|uniref:Zinc ribbon domain-containing protein n=1 Tax=Halorubrum rubrum TaxID=1126240 RepID=A0ABD5R3R5_9EURY|nr:zinc ribbon domain-containing protein [Halorubrum rubrum]